MSVEGLQTPGEKEIARLRSSRRGRYTVLLLKVFAGFVLLLITVVLALVAYHQYGGGAGDPAAIQNRLYNLQAPWANHFGDAMHAYRTWLVDHGTSTEAALFDDVSVILAESALQVSSEGGERLPFFSALYVWLHGGMMRLAFLGLASFRLVCAVTLIAGAFGLRAYAPYRGQDLLGQMGNGRLFYSGLRAGLEDLAPNGAPGLQALGLVCLNSARPEQVKASPVWSVLSQWDALNPTNEALAAFLVQYSNTTPYVAGPDEDGMLKKAFAGGTLDGHAACLLEAALKRHQEYASGDINSPARDLPAATEAESSEEYARRLEIAMHRVLSPAHRELIGVLPASEIATTVLAFETGKILAHSFEGGRWIRKSNFPQLSARAVLHSVAAYPKDYDYEQRLRIRRAIIFASRSSAFAPVRMPVDLTEDAWALRQWTELLMACPHELAAVADEVELAGLVRKANHDWVQEFLDGAAALTPEVAQSSFSTPSDALFVPLSRVLSVLRRRLTTDIIRRIEHLVGVVSTRQRLRILEAQNSEQGTLEHPTFDRVYPLLTGEEFEVLSKNHSTTAEDLRDWSALRIVLSSYGWLARRVGDYTVPESALIYAVFQAEGSHSEANQLGLIGKTGMVAFRGSKLEERWGGGWTERFTVVAGATMAERPEDYERLLKGIKDPEEEESLADAASLLG